MHANQFGLYANHLRGPLIALAAALAACGSGSGGVSPDRQTDGIGASSNTGAGSPSINGGAGGPSIGGGAGTPVIDGPSSGSAGTGGGCGADSASCQALRSAFAAGGEDAFDCSNTGYPQWTVSTYVTPDGAGQCVLRDGYIAAALSDCWAFHCTTDASSCAAYAADVGTQLCDAAELCGSGSLGNDVCTTQTQLPCAAISCSN